MGVSFQCVEGRRSTDLEWFFTAEKGPYLSENTDPGSDFSVETFHISLLHRLIAPGMVLSF